MKPRELMLCIVAAVIASAVGSGLTALLLGSSLREKSATIAALRASLRSQIEEPKRVGQPTIVYPSELTIVARAEDGGGAYYLWDAKNGAWYYSANAPTKGGTP